jgi:16S rRNA (guanine966-N2)-methyltransferase
LVRPATDAMRQAVFSSLGDRVDGAGFLDLFAGSGGYGLEALSRGARRGTFVEKSPKAAACLRQNIAAVRKSLGASGGAAADQTAAGGNGDREVVVVEGDVFSGGWPEVAPDLVFVDPPYDQIEAVAPRVFARLYELYPSVEAMLVVFEAPGENSLAPFGWVLRKRLGKGARQPTASIFSRAASRVG